MSNVFGRKTGSGAEAMDSSKSKELEERLREAGLRVTATRVEVYEFLRELGGHHSVDDIFKALTERGHKIPRMTVYNVVTDLEGVGLLMCADAGPGRALYEVADVWHHHYVCRVCGTIFDVPCLVGEKPCLTPPGTLPGSVDEAQVIFRGVCRDCSGSEKGVNE